MYEAIARRAREAHLAGAKESIFTQRIVVWTVLTLAGGDRRDAEGQSAEPRLENTLRAQQGNALAFERETRGEELTRQQVRAKPALFVEKRERGQPDAKVGVVYAGEILPSLIRPVRRAHDRLHVTTSLAMPTAAKSRSRDKVRAHRARMRKKGMRLVQIWLPDVRSKAFKRRAHLDSLAIARSPQAKEDQDFVDAVSVWKFE